jgi:predicted CXXCH cytochrome family protein
VVEAAVEGEAKLHRPVEQRRCMACHKMHEPDASPNLARGQLELCSGCHESIAARVNDATKHAPFAKGQCSKCHNTHVAGEAHMLKKSQDQLCRTCHRLGKPEMAASHENVPLTGSGCTTCHDPHSVARSGGKLVYSYQHSPYEDKECDVCHEESGEPPATFSVCADCHDNDDDFLNVHNAGRDVTESMSVRICLDCHSPHAGHETLLMRQSQKETCLQCHDRSEFSRRVVHGAVDLGCATCHDLHSNNIADLRSPGVNALCAGCHEESKMHMHPLGDEFKDPRTNDTLTCLSCHEPHSSEFNYILTFDRERDLCVQCHAAGTMKVH